MKLFNRVGFATPTIGTGNLAIGAAIRSATDGDYLTPAEAGAVDGDQSPYFIVDGHSFAQGLGTYSSTGPTLVRDAAERNWNGTTEAAGKLALSGNAVVFISPRAADILQAAGITTNGVLFGGAGGVLSQDNANLIWDNATKMLHVSGLRFSPTEFARNSATSGLNLYGGFGGVSPHPRFTLYGGDHASNSGIAFIDATHFRVRSLVGAEWARFVDGKLGIGESSPDYTLDVNGPFGFTPGTDVTPVDNGDVTIDAPTNGSVRVRHKGSDGTVRAFTLPLGETPATLGAAQTLTNKTLETPGLNTPSFGNFSPTVGGQMGRSGGNFQVHDGVAVRLLVTDSNTVTMLNKTLTAPVITDPKTRSTVRTVTGTTDTLVLADEGKRVETSNGSATTITVPPNSSVAFAVSAEIDLLQVGAGQVTVVAGAGVTINGTPGLKLRAQWSAATLIKRGTDTWVLVGDLSA